MTQGFQNSFQNCNGEKQTPYRLSNIGFLYLITSQYFQLHVCNNSVYRLQEEQRLVEENNAVIDSHHARPDRICSQANAPKHAHQCFFKRLKVYQRQKIRQINRPKHDFHTYFIPVII